MTLVTSSAGYAVPNSVAGVVIPDSRRSRPLPRSINASVGEVWHLCPADQLSNRAARHRAAPDHAIPFHTDRLIGELADALCEVWNGLGLPLEAQVVPFLRIAFLRRAA